MSQPTQTARLLSCPLRYLVGAVLGVGLVLTWLWACFGDSGETPPSDSTTVAGGAVDAIPQTAGNTPVYHPAALIARPADAAMASIVPKAAPATPVSTVPISASPDWRRMPPARLPDRSATELEESLVKSSFVVGLYDPKAPKASYLTITRRMDDVRNAHRDAIGKQRDAALNALASDPRTKQIAGRFGQLLRQPQGSLSSAVERARDRVLGTLLQRMGNAEQRSRVHEQSLHVAVVQSWSKSRSDFAGLPFEDFEHCELGYQPAAKLGEHSPTFRRLLSSRGRGRPRLVANGQLTSHLQRTQWKAADVPALVQILQVETEDVREQLVKILARISGPQSSKALAQRAVFDTSSRVREQATAALATRESDVVRPVLLKALRHPWAPAAEHAAQALAGMNDVDAVPELERMLNEPAPGTPCRDSNGDWSVRELVRVNHMRNCYLCHAPSLSDYDTVRGFVPSPGEELPRVYYSAPSGYFVRADVTYLRQDFSVKHAVADHAPWPEVQRFDYLVRNRPITSDEAAKLRERAPKTYPQRNAALYALQHLSTARTKPQAGDSADGS